MDWLLINSKAPKTDIILAMHAVLVRHHEAETNIYGCNMYLIGGIKKFNRVPVTPLLISTLKLTRSPRCYHYCTRPFGLFVFFSRPIIFLFSHFREGNVIKKIALTRRNLTVTKRICSIFVKCTLPKKKKKNTCQGITQKHFKSWRFHFTWWFSRSFSIKYSVCTCRGKLTNFNKTLLFCSIL